MATLEFFGWLVAEATGCHVWLHGVREEAGAHVRFAARNPQQARRIASALNEVADEHASSDAVRATTPLRGCACGKRTRKGRDPGAPELARNGAQGIAGPGSGGARAEPEQELISSRERMLTSGISGQAPGRSAARRLGAAR